MDTNSFHDTELGMGIPSWQLFPMKVLSREESEREHATRKDDMPRVNITPLEPGAATWRGTDAQLYHQALDRLNFTRNTRLRLFSTTQEQGSNDATNWQSAEYVRKHLPEMVSVSHVYG